MLKDIIEFRVNDLTEFIEYRDKNPKEYLKFEPPVRQTGVILQCHEDTGKQIGSLNWCSFILQSYISDSAPFRKNYIASWTTIVKHRSNSM